jgi:2'-hydroxyisoflavone reductase
MRILVIGGTRFVGRAIVDELLARGDEVTVLHRGRTPNPFVDRVEELRADRHDRAAVLSVLEGRAFDGVVDVAYDGAVGTGGREITHVLEAVSRSVPRYVYISSASVYKDTRLGILEDDARASEPFDSDYSKNKVQAEEAVERAHHAGRVVGTLIRPVLIYGAYDPAPRERWLWDRIVAGRPVIVPETGGTIFHWVAATDVAWMAGESLRHPQAAGQAFNVAEAKPISHAAFVDRLADAAGRSVEKVCVPRQKLEAAASTASPPRPYFGTMLDFGVDFGVDIAKARRTIGFTPTDPASGWKRAFAWYDREGRNPEPDFRLEREILGR